ncbi:MAG: hypothetical protein R2855_13425 [Thermomicrobiales bacterium]
MRFVCGDDPAAVFQQFAATLDGTTRFARSRRKAHARFAGNPAGWLSPPRCTPADWSRWSMASLVGTFRSHQVPLSGVKQDPAHLQISQWLRSYNPTSSSIALANSCRNLAELAPTGDRRMGANPYIGGKLLVD